MFSACRSLRSLAVVALVAVLGAGACSPKPRVRTTGAESAASVARFRSYVIVVVEEAPQGYSPAKRSKLVLDMARPKVDAELGKKGYVVASAEDSADLIVRIAAGVKTVVDHPRGAEAAAGGDSEIDEVSTLAVNIVERKSKESLFAGSASKEIHSKTVKDADVTSAVVEILASIPASSPATP